MNYPNASQGLKLVFYGEIVMIIGLLLVWVPLVGSLIIIVGGILDIVGLNKAMADDNGYQTALILSVVNIVVSAVSNFAGDGVVGSLMSLVSTVVSLGVTYYVVTTTCNLLHSVGAADIEAKGKTVWTINLVCAVVSVVLDVLMLVPIIQILAAVGAFIVAIVTLVGYVLYLLFLNKAYPALA
jgi:hypothetical protein